MTHPAEIAELQQPAPRKRHLDHVAAIQEWARTKAGRQSRWSLPNDFFRRSSEDYLKFLVPENQRILSLGCGAGDTMARLNPAFGLGIDLDASALQIAQTKYPRLQFMEGDMEDAGLIEQIAQNLPFDVVLLDGSLGYLDDIQTFLTRLQAVCNEDTRVVSVYYGYLWEPVLRLAEKLQLREPSLNTTWLRMSDVENFMTLGGFETIKKEWRVLLPFRMFGLGNLVNRYVAPLPWIRRLALSHYLVARKKPKYSLQEQSVSVVIPCRNEWGNIEPAIQRLPKLGSSTEIIFVEGHSTDGTWEEVKRVQKIYPGLDISILQQTGEGKGDAVRAGFDLAKGDILMILDADLTVPPEDLEKFVEIICSGKGEYVNGSRLIYGMEDQAMRFLNFLANHFFALVFTFLINQRLTDTLCGTKVLTRKNYQRIKAGRTYFGTFDPFGDFDLIFGASKLNLKFAEVPVRYASRRYGSTQISRFRHGLLLLRMVVFAYRKLKAI
jgi:SAM-dependent methyltransferase